MKRLRLLLLTVLITAAALPARAVEPLWPAPAARCDMMGDNKGRLNGRYSRFIVSYDRNNFYLEADCRPRPGEVITARGRHPDDLAIFGGDHVELMLTPRPAEENPCYFHLVVNPGGLMYTARRRDTGWEPAGVKVASTVTAAGKRWQLRLTIPFAALNEVCPAAGAEWRILIGRDAETICMADDYHEVSSHLPLIFSPPPRPPVCLNQVRLDGSRCEFEFDTMNLPPQVLAEISCRGEILSRQTLTVSGGQLVFSADLGKYLPLKNLYPVAVRLRDTAGKLLYCREGTVQGANSNPVELDAFYLPPGRPLGYRQTLGDGVTYRVYTDTAVLAQGPAAAAGKIVLPADVSGRAVVRFDSPAGWTTRRIHLLSAVPGPVKPAAGDLTLSPDRKILRGGRPVYLLGPSFFGESFYPFSPEFNFTSGGGGTASGAAKVCNLPEVPYQRQPFSSRIYGPWEQYRRLLDGFLPGCTDGGNLYRLSYEANIPLAVTDGAGKTMPADSAPYMAQIYRRCKELCPDRLFSIQIDEPGRIRDYCGSCDVMELACGASSYGEYMIPALPANLDRVLAAVPADKPVMYWLGGTIPDPRCRTAEELRAAVYICMLAGISGNFIHMGHAAMAADRTRFWSLLSGITREIDAVYPVLARGRKLPDFLRETPEAGFIWQAAAADSGTLLVIVNTDAIGKNFSARRRDGRRFEAEFTPYEVRIFRFPPETGGSGPAAGK